jgi:hypothetical protein
MEYAGQSGKESREMQLVSIGVSGQGVTTLGRLFWPISVLSKPIDKGMWKFRNSTISHCGYSI